MLKTVDDESELKPLGHAAGRPLQCGSYSSLHDWPVVVQYFGVPYIPRYAVRPVGGPGTQMVVLAKETGLSETLHSLELMGVATA